MRRRISIQVLAGWPFQRKILHHYYSQHFARRMSRWHFQNVTSLRLITDWLNSSSQVVAITTTTEHFTILEPQNPSIDISELHKIREYI